MSEKQDPVLSLTQKHVEFVSYSKDEPMPSLSSNQSTSIKANNCSEDFFARVRRHRRRHSLTYSLSLSLSHHLLCDARYSRGKVSDDGSQLH